MAKVLYPLENADEIGKKYTLPNVDSQRHVFDFTTLLMAELDEGGQQGGGKVINTEVADVFETLQRVGFARTGKTGNHHEL